MKTYGHGRVLNKKSKQIRLRHAKKARSPCCGGAGGQCDIHIRRDTHVPNYFGIKRLFRKPVPNSVASELPEVRNSGLSPRADCIANLISVLPALPRAAPSLCSPQFVPISPSSSAASAHFISSSPNRCSTFPCRSPPTCCRPRDRPSGSWGT